MKYITFACCMVALAGCSSSDDDGSLTDLDSNDSDVVDVTEVDVMAVAANPDAVFVTPEGVNFQETPFPGVELANAFSNDDTGSHETFVRVAAGGEIPPHMHTQGTYSVVVSGPMEIPAKIASSSYIKTVLLMCFQQAVFDPKWELLLEILLLEKCRLMTLPDLWT